MIETYDTTVTRTLYDTDFNLWVEAQVVALRQGQMQNLYLENLAEEVTGLGTSQKSALRSHLRVLLLHLLQWTYPAGRRSRSWRSTII